MLPHRTAGRRRAPPPSPSRDPKGRAERARAAARPSRRAPKEMSNAPSDSSRICSHSSSTVRISGLESSTASSPHAMRMISVSGRHVLKRSSTRANHATHASIARSAVAMGGSPSERRRSTLMTVPHCSKTRRTDCMGESRSSDRPCRVRSAAIARSSRWCTTLRRGCRSARSAPAGLPGAGAARPAG